MNTGKKFYYQKHRYQNQKLFVVQLLCKLIKHEEQLEIDGGRTAKLSFQEPRFARPIGLSEQSSPEMEM